MVDGGIDLKWMLGQSIALAVAFVGGLWKVSSKASAGDRALHTKIDNGNMALSAKIETVKEKYVRRDDHKEDMAKIDRHLEKMDSKLDQLIARK